MTDQKPEPDFLIHAGGYASIWLFEPVSDAAKEVTETIFIEPWQWMGAKFAVDHRAARGLASLLSDDGFVLFNPAYGYFQH